MKTKFKAVSSILIAVTIMSAALGGCASEDVVLEQKEVEDNIYMMQQSLSDEELEDAARSYQSYLGDISVELPEIWSDINKQDYHLVITNGHKTYYISKEFYEEIDSGQDNDDVDSVLQMLQYAVGMYQPMTYHGKNVTAMNLMKTGDTCTEEDLIRNFAILMHESFHLHTQSEWKGINISQTENGTQSNMRASDYPLDEQPRIMRTMLYNCLYSALNAQNINEEEKYMEHAKYWYEKWENEYAYEYSAIKETDLAEGTAEYFGNEIKRIIQEDKYSLVTPEEFAAESQSADAESYNLGDIAIQLLKKRDVFKVSDFEDQGKTPLESLFADVEKSTPSTTNDKLEKIVSDNIAAINAQVSESFSEYMEADTKGQMTYIGVKSESLTGIMSEGFYYLTQIHKTGWQNASISNINIQVDNRILMEYKDMILIPITESEMTVKDNVITGISADGITLNASVTYEKNQDLNGNTIYRLLESE